MLYKHSNFYSCCFKHFFSIFVTAKESLDIWLFFPARRPLNDVQIYVLQNSLLLAKLVFKGSSKHSSCNKVLEASCLPSRFHQTKFSWISTVCKYLRKHCVIIFFPPRISSYRYCQLVTTTDGKTRIIYFCFRRFLEFQIVSFFPHKYLEFYILGHHSKSS